MFDFASIAARKVTSPTSTRKASSAYDRETPKDAFYFYRANWSAPPTLHLVGRRYVDRPYGVIDMKVYSNAKTVHLWLNGGDIGVASCTDGICLWPAVHLVPGSNIVLAKADFGGTTLSDTLQWNYAGTPQVVRIKSGDITGYVAQDGSRYGSDMYFEGGTGRGINPPDTADKDRVAVPGANAALYDSFREGDFDYRIPLPDGRYRILAKFVEPSATAVGQRAFDVVVNGKTVFSRFDVFAEAGGRFKAVDRTFDAEVVDGKIDIRFQSVQGKAIVSALCVTPISSGAD